MAIKKKTNKRKVKEEEGKREAFKESVPRKLNAWNETSGFESTREVDGLISHAKKGKKGKMKACRRVPRKRGRRITDGQKTRRT